MNREVICFDAVAPARERGLKYDRKGELMNPPFGRSREGAWIEIRAFRSFNKIKECRSREGAWIEM